VLGGEEGAGGDAKEENLMLMLISVRWLRSVDAAA
jgi:hypothetical protein